jgi:prepilin-type N-terminal cleavage/methylation domain-containing protein
MSVSTGRSTGFTIIELIAAVTILTVLALMAVPLVNDTQTDQVKIRERLAEIEAQAWSQMSSTQEEAQCEGGTGNDRQPNRPDLFFPAYQVNRPSVVLL